MAGHTNTACMACRCSVLSCFILGWGGEVLLLAGVLWLGCHSCVDSHEGWAAWCNLQRRRAFVTRNLTQMLLLLLEQQLSRRVVLTAAGPSPAGTCICVASAQCVALSFSAHAYGSLFCACVGSVFYSVHGCVALSFILCMCVALLSFPVPCIDCG